MDYIKDSIDAAPFSPEKNLSVKKNDCTCKAAEWFIEYCGLHKNVHIFKGRYVESAGKKYQEIKDPDSSEKPIKNFKEKEFQNHLRN